MKKFKVISGVAYSKLTENEKEEYTYEYYFKHSKPQIDQLTEEYKEELIRKEFKQQREWRIRVREFVDNWKKQGCQVCGYIDVTRPWQFDAHHKDPLKKEFTISKIHSIKRLKAELEKCICMCALCHRDIHHHL